MEVPALEQPRTEVPPLEEPLTPYDKGWVATFFFRHNNKKKENGKFK